MILPRLHLVTDDVVLGAASFCTLAEEVLAVAGPAVALHLRGHGRPAASLYRIAARLGPAAREAGSALILNDRVDIVLALAAAGSAAGVQLGRRSIPVADARRLVGGRAVIGYSAHGEEEAAAAVAAGADFVVLGTIYPTRSHPGRAPAGVELVGRTARRVAAPVVAIGGVSRERIPELKAAGAHGVAVLGAVWRAPDPGTAVRLFLDALDAEYSGDAGVSSGRESGVDGTATAGSSW